MINTRSKAPNRYDARTSGTRYSEALFQRISFLAVALFISFPAGAANLAVVPSSSQVALNATFTVEVGITGLGDFTAPSVGAFDLTVNYDPALFSFNSVNFGDPALGDQLNLSGFGTLPGTNASAGSTEFYELSFDDVDTLNTLQPSSFMLATLQFQAIGAGSGTFSISSPVLSDAIGNPIPIGSTRRAAVEVLATPEPSAVVPSVLIVAGILLPIRFRNRRRHMPARTCHQS